VENYVQARRNFYNRWHLERQGGHFGCGLPIVDCGFETYAASENKTPRPLKVSC